MKRTIARGILVLALLSTAAASGYFFYAWATAPTWKELGGGAAIALILLAGVVIDYFFFRDYVKPGPQDVQFQIHPPRPKPEPPALQSAFTTLGLTLMVIFGIYVRHTVYGSERTMPLDTWWPVILPVATGLAGLAWLTDTFFLRIVNGSYSGRSHASLRFALFAKRLTAAILAFAALYGLGMWHLDTVLEAYRSPVAQAWLASAMALIASLVVIRR